MSINWNSIRIKSYTVIISVVMLFVNGCTPSQKPVNSIEFSDANSAYVVKNDLVEGTEIVPESIEEGITEVDNFKIQDCTHSLRYETKYASIEEMFSRTDPNWNLSYEYTSAVASYTEIFSDIYNGSTEFKGSVPHFAFAYIDGDDIPEFLVSYGNNYIYGVGVYRYDINENKTVYIGEFGSFGSAGYYERTSLIECYYGNCGCITYYLSEINGIEVKLKDSWLIDESGLVTEEVRYYHGYLVPDMFNGTREAFAHNNANELYINFDVNDNHQIPEDEFMRKIDDWIGFSQEIYVSVSYNTMCRIGED